MGSPSITDRVPVSPQGDARGSDLAPLLAALTALGPVLCFGPSAADGAAAGTCSIEWVSRIVEAQWYAVAAGDSLFEQIEVGGTAGCLRLMLLPDTNFLAWDTLIEILGDRLPMRPAGARGQGSAQVCRFEPVMFARARLLRRRDEAGLSACGRYVLGLVAPHGRGST